MDLLDSRRLFFADWPLAASLALKPFRWLLAGETDHLATGDESDHWLGNTVGALVTANAVVFLAAAWAGVKLSTSQYWE